MPRARSCGSAAAFDPVAGIGFSNDRRFASEKIPVAHLSTFGQALGLNAHLFGDRIGASDLERAMTFRQWNERSCRLANALLGMGLAKGDRVAVLAYNCVEWLEIYAATAKAGLIAVPVNFRLVGPEVAYIVGNCEARAMIVQDALAGVVEEVRADLPIPETSYIHLGGGACPAGYRAYEAMLAAARDTEPGCRTFDILVDPNDPASAMLYEVYDDEAAFEAHQKTSHFKKYLDTALQWLESRERQFYRRAAP